MSTSVDATNIPRYAIFRGKKVRILEYMGQTSRSFRILDTDDSTRWVNRHQLQFIPEKSKETK